MRLTITALALLALLTSCAMPPTYRTTTLDWTGTATWRQFGLSHYHGQCAEGLHSGAARVFGEWVYPNSIYLAASVCGGDTTTLAVLAHEVAHMTVCGSDERCAVTTSARWLRQGITLRALGWRQP